MAPLGRRRIWFIIRDCNPLNEPVCFGILVVNADLSSTLATLTTVQISSHYCDDSLVNKTRPLNASSPSMTDESAFVSPRAESIQRSIKSTILSFPCAMSCEDARNISSNLPLGIE